ncbi:MAG: serine hydrolase domain-containing protein [Tepidisphaeraceae bacterium]
MRFNASFLLLIEVIAMLNQGCASVKEQPETAQWPKMSGIDRAMQAWVDRGEISGAVTLVADRQGILHLSAVGQRDLKRRLPMRTDTIFWIASMTKLMTATAVMMLQDEGKLSIDDPVSKYIPEFAGLKAPSGKPANLTLRHLLTHTSGLAEAPRDVLLKARTLGELVPFYLDRPTSFEPGKKWDYCQSGINTLGRIIEIVSGESYADFLQSRLFDPMGMKDATFYPSEEQIQRLAQSYVLKKGRLERIQIDRPVGIRHHFPAANGGLFCTAGEFCRFCQMLLNGGMLDGRGYLSAKSIDEMTSVQTDGLKTGFVPGSGWGLGFGIVREPRGITAMLSPGTFGHGGAYGTEAWIDPVKGRIYILLIQRGDLDNADNSQFRQAFQEAAAP